MKYDYDLFIDRVAEEILERVPVLIISLEKGFYNNSGCVGSLLIVGKNYNDTNQLKWRWIHVGDTGKFYTMAEISIKDFYRFMFGNLLRDKCLPFISLCNNPNGKILKSYYRRK